MVNLKRCSASLPRCRVGNRLRCQDIVGEQVGESPFKSGTVVRDERGMALVVFGLWLIVIFGFAAFSLDVSRIYNEHSELRNGADAAALAIARDCGQSLCDGSYDEYAVGEAYADPNARDGAMWVEDVDIDFTDQTVTVHVATEDTLGGNNLDMVLAKVLGYNGLTVRADTTVKWGAPAGFTSLPLAFSRCEWNDFGAPGFVDENPLGFLHRSTAVYDNDLPPSSGYLYEPKFVTIYLHGSSVCGGSPSGADIPGGFGWMDPTAGCTLTSGLGDWFEIDPGASPPSGCSPGQMGNIVGTVQYVPYFDDVVGTGTSAQYHIDGYGALYVTGYNFGGGYKEDSLIDGLPPCTGDDRCIQGYMIGDWVESNIPAGLGGGGYGVVSLELVG